MSKMSKKIKRIKEKDEVRRARINHLQEVIEGEQRELGRFESYVLVSKNRIKKYQKELDKLYKEDSVGVCRAY